MNVCRFTQTSTGSESRITGQSNGLQTTLGLTSGLSFELICLTHLPQIKNALQIGGISTDASSWRIATDKEKGIDGAQIDLVISRADRMIHLCEMKFSVNPYIITADYEEKIRNRTALFAESTKTTYSLLVTFVTVYGVTEGIHSGLLHSEVTANDLFQPGF